MKPLLILLGFLSALLVISQLVMGLLIVRGNISLKVAHQHSGYLTVAVTLTYVLLSLLFIARTPRNPNS
jgi:hypothetical protein